MAVFDGHLKCARCRHKGVGDDSCVLEKDCSICKAFTLEQLQQLTTPTYRDRKNREKKMVSASPTPTLVDPSQVSVLGRVDREKAVKKPETTPAGKKKRSDESPKPSKKRSSSKPSTEDLKSLDDKWAERFARLEAMILAKLFAVPVEPVGSMQKLSPVRSPSFDPGAGSSQSTSGGVSDVSFTVPALFRPPGKVLSSKLTSLLRLPVREGEM